MLIISDQFAVGVSRESGLSSSGETEEESDIALLGTDVGGGVERELTKLDGLEVVHDGEDTFLHLSCVLGTKDDHFHALEVDLNRSGGAHTLGESICRELAGIVDDEVWLAEVEELLFSRSDQHVVL